jgi:L-histidine N-alpha-methyltransferase
MARDASTSAFNSQSVDAALMSEVLEGLSRPQKSLPPKLFYDERGSRLFERICEQPEYYIPATESALLRSRATDLAAFCGPRCVIMEPGAGTAEKPRSCCARWNSRRPMCRSRFPKPRSISA